MLDMTQFAAIPCLVIILYIIGFALKISCLKNHTQFVPIACAVIGAVLAVIAYMYIPGTVPGDNVLVALCCGIVSGLTATGSNQVYWQIKKSIKEANEAHTEE